LKNSNVVERSRRPVEHFDEAQRLQVRRARDLLEQSTDEGHRQVPCRKPPIELRRRPDGLARPEHPSGEDAVEQGLDESRPKKMIALVGVKRHPERLFERGANTG
jgi:hypothetical protein